MITIPVFSWLVLLGRSQCVQGREAYKALSVGTVMGAGSLHLLVSQGLSRLARSAMAASLAPPGNFVSPADFTLRSGPGMSADEASSRGLDHWPKSCPANFGHRRPDLARVDRPAPIGSKLASEHGANMGTNRTHRNRPGQNVNVSSWMSASSTPSSCRARRTDAVMPGGPHR
jgi:hypothetical protein